MSVLLSLRSTVSGAATPGLRAATAPSNSVTLPTALPSPYQRPSRCEGIVKDGQVTRGWIGVEPQELNAELAETFNVKAKSGVIITGVLQNGPAAQAGIQPGDVVVAVNGKAVGTVTELLGAVAALKPGVAAPLTVLRKDKKTDIAVTPDKRQRPKVSREAER